MDEKNPYKVKVVFETVVMASGLAEAEQLTPQVVKKEDDTPTFVMAVPLTSLDELPEGWNGDCIPWLSQDETMLKDMTLKAATPTEDTTKSMHQRAMEALLPIKKGDKFYVLGAAVDKAGGWAGTWLPKTMDKALGQILEAERDIEDYRPAGVPLCFPGALLVCGFFPAHVLQRAATVKPGYQEVEQPPQQLEIAIILQEARDYADLTVADLARLSGVSGSMIRHLEKGTAKLGSTTLIKLATALPFPHAARKRLIQWVELTCPEVQADPRVLSDKLVWGDEDPAWAKELAAQQEAEVTGQSLAVEPTPEGEELTGQHLLQLYTLVEESKERLEQSKEALRVAIELYTGHPLPIRKA